MWLCYCHSEIEQFLVGFPLSSFPVPVAVSLYTLAKCCLNRLFSDPARAHTATLKAAVDLALEGATTHEAGHVVLQEARHVAGKIVVYSVLMKRSRCKILCSGVKTYGKHLDTLLFVNFVFGCFSTSNDDMHA